MALQSAQLITPEELAEYLGVSKTQLAQWRTKGLGPTYTKLGPGRNAQVRYRLDEIEAWLESNTITPSHVAD